MTLERLPAEHSRSVLRFWGDSGRSGGRRTYRPRGGHYGLWMARTFCTLRGARRGTKWKAYRDPRFSRRARRNERRGHCHEPALSSSRSLHPKSDRRQVPIPRLVTPDQFPRISQPPCVVAGLPAKPDLDFKPPPSDDAPARLERTAINEQSSFLLDGLGWPESCPCAMIHGLASIGSIGKR
jgi:hypothetical protein